MKIFNQVSYNLDSGKNFQNNIADSMNSNMSFRGMAELLPQPDVYSADSAIKTWEALKDPKYTDVFQPSEFATEQMLEKNRERREHNYSFLDKLTDREDKKKFIEHFRKTTGFPSLKDSSQKIVDEFSRALNVAMKNLGRKPDSSKGVLMSGYDRYCSVGLDRALPGSDLDKGYAIIRGVEDDSDADKAFSNSVKEQIRKNIDNRIMSLNHYAAFPNILTDNELKEAIKTADTYAKRVATPENINFFRWLRLTGDKAIPASKFNIYLTDLIENDKTKADIKNLAYIVETMRDGNRITLTFPYEEEFYNLFANSPFCHCSNVAQNKIMEDKYNNGSDEETMKPKLLARREVERNFDSLDVDEQYDIVKDVIRSMSEDSNNPKFEDMFYSKKDKIRLLLNDILRGKVKCSFESVPQGERIHLFFDADTAPKYYDVNAFD